MKKLNKIEVIEIFAKSVEQLVLDGDFPAHEERVRTLIKQVISEKQKEALKEGLLSSF